MVGIPGPRPGSPRAPGSGRKPGTPNKATKDLAEAAREYTHEALKVMVAIMRDESAPEAARISAAEAVLCRGYGKPKQSVELAGDQSKPIRMIADKPVTIEDWKAAYGRADIDLGATGGAAESTH